MISIFFTAIVHNSDSLRSAKHPISRNMWTIQAPRNSVQYELKKEVSLVNVACGTVFAGSPVTGCESLIRFSHEGKDRECVDCIPALRSCRRLEMALLEVAQVGRRLRRSRKLAIS